MTSGANLKLKNFSEGLFQRLLVIYPKAHRDEYGPSMNQLFRDQCRDAWSEGRNRGLIKLWLRVFPDLLRSSLIEHLAAFKEKSMSERINHLLRSPSTPWRTFTTVFVAIFLLVLTTSVLITFLSPETYNGITRIRIETGKGYDPLKAQTAFEVIRSELILGRVVDELDLRTVWGKRYSAGAALKTSDAVDKLRARIELRPIRNTQLVEIRAYSENPREAAAIANAVAETYVEYGRELRRQARMREATPGRYEVDDSMVEIIDTAVPVHDPVRPNKALNIFLGAWAGIILGLSVGGGIGAIAYLLGRKVQKNPA